MTRVKPVQKAAALLVGAIAVISLMAPLAHADMRGPDISNWQCGIDTASLDADFVVVGTTWGTGTVNGGCLGNGVNTDANRMLSGAKNSGKATGVYHYAMGNNVIAEADFFVDNIKGYVGNSILVLDWEPQDNRAWGNGNWVREWVNRVHARTGVWPVIYVSASAINTVPSDVWENCGLWVAQYASMNATGYQAQPWNYGAYGEAMRQYTSNGRIAGYSGPLDLNYFRGTREQWEKYANPGNANTGAITPAPSVNYDALADAVIRGDYGNGDARKNALGDNYARVMEIVNRRLGVQSVTQRVSVVVQSGDTMSAIASRTGLTPASAWQVPSGDINRIYPGEIVVYGGAGGQNEVRTVTVKTGDTLSSIAARLGVSWTQLSGYRSGNPNVIYPGEVLCY